MPVTKLVPTPHYAAEQPILDGPACVQMVLDQIGKNPVDTQAAIQSEIDANESEPGFWWSDPAGVKGALNALKPAPPVFNNAFVTFAFDSVEDACRKLTYTLHRYEVAPAALVYGGSHWVLVIGVVTDVDPMTKSEYAIEGFHVHNPWPGDPFPSDTGINQWIDYATWTSHFSPVGHGVQWLNKHVSVNDPELPRSGRLRTSDRKPRRHGDEFMPASEVPDLIQQEIDDLGIAERPGWSDILSSGRPGDPLLMQWPDGDLIRYFYLVPWRRSSRSTTAVFLMEASFGRLRQAIPLDPATPWPGTSSTALLKRLKAGVIDVVVDLSEARSRPVPVPPGPAFPRRFAGPLTGARLRPVRSLKPPLAETRIEKLRLRPGTWCLQQALFWVPCWESRSPSYPFHILSVGDRIYYISTLDGLAYPRLHQFPSGINAGGA